MSFEVHREPLYRRYYAPACSCACLYALVFGFLLILLPLIIAYNTSTFWIKQDVTYEQPQVTYRYLSILTLEGSQYSADGTQFPLNLYYSTKNALNNLNNNYLRVPIFKSAELDDNRDGVTDRLEIGIQMPLQVSETINSFSLLCHFDVKLSGMAKYQFDAVTYINYETSNSISEFTVDGDMKIRQTMPLSGTGGYKSPYAGSYLIDVHPGASANNLSISAVMARSTARNLSTVFNNNYNYASRGPGSFF